MIKIDLAMETARRTGITVAETKKTLDAAFAVIAEEAAKGNVVRIREFGTFKSKTRPAHTGTNPRTHEKMAILERTSPVFIPSSVFKERFG